MKNFIKHIIDRIRRKPLLVKPVVMPSLFDISDEDLLFYLEHGQIYLQHDYNSNMPEYFKNIKWYWNKDTEYTQTIDHSNWGLSWAEPLCCDEEKITSEIKYKNAANKTYKSVKDWLFYCGGRNSGLWHLNWA